MKRQMQTMGPIHLEASRIIYGCMNIGGGWNHDAITAEQEQKATQAIETAIESGINIFDHADIYCHGKSEEIFGKILSQKPELREKIFLQSKCGIRFPGDPSENAPGRYDFSYEHIVSSVEGCLSRLKTSYLDVLMLHRPDLLIEPEEVARAFDHLHQSGKVRYFGVSNHTPLQMDLLQGHLSQPLVVNQVQLSLLHTDLLDSGIASGKIRPESYGCAGTIEYCRLHGITLQAWSPLAGGRVFSEEAGEALTKQLQEISQQKNTSPDAIALSWILRHPAEIQVVVGTTNPERIRSACSADMVQLTREEWYSLYLAARGENLP